MKQICQNGINSMGFNRYMVECEFIIIIVYSLICRCFNRYMVECE